ncbi:MAG: AroM family protein [bacterium]
MPFKIGALLIGHSPRADFDEYFHACLPPGGELLTIGALDDLTTAQIQTLPIRSGEDVLATITRDKVPVTVPTEAVHARMPEKLAFLEANGADIVVVCCTGDFPFLQSRVPLFLPSEILTKVVAAVAAGKKISVLIPIAEQAEQLRPRWVAAGLDPVFHTVSPFTEPESLADAGRKCAAENTAIVVMDCMGYTRAMKDTVRRSAGKPVISARTILARVIAELA